MNRTERIIWLVCVILTLTVMIGIIECRADTVSHTSLESEVSCGRMGRELIDRGDYELAVSSLE